MRTALLVGDALTVLKTLPDGIAQCCVTSPPYWGLRTYGVKDQLGLERTPEEYVSKLVGVFREVRRVLRDDAVLWLNMGDSYGSGTSSRRKPTETAKHGYWENSQIAVRNMFQPKQLIGMPWRLAFALQADGWWLRRDVIWNKPNPMPESCTDRPTSSHEYIFLLTKSGTSQYWTHRERDGVRTKPKADWRWVNQITQEEVAEAPPDWKEIITCPECAGKGSVAVNELMGEPIDDWGDIDCPTCDGKKEVQHWKRINLWRGHDYLYDQEAVREPQEKSSLERYAYKLGGFQKYDLADNTEVNYFNPKTEQAARDKALHGRGRNLRSVWTFPTEPYPEAHFATYPRELARRCILAGTSAKGACPECGAAWERVREKCGERKVRWKKGAQVLQHGYTGGPVGCIATGKIDEYKTVGWCPTCSCRDRQGGHTDTVPCTVVDPFVGSGTTAEVAIDLDRDFIASDLSEHYIRDFATPRVQAAQKRQAARKQQEVLSL